MFNSYEELEKLKLQKSDIDMIAKIIECQRVYLGSSIWGILSKILFFLAFGLFFANKCNFNGIIITIWFLKAFSDMKHVSTNDSYFELKKLIDSFFEKQDEESKDLDKNKELQEEKDDCYSYRQLKVKQKLDPLYSYYKEQIRILDEEEKEEIKIQTIHEKKQKLEVLSLYYKEQIRILDEEENENVKTKVIRK